MAFNITERLKRIRAPLLRHGHEMSEPQVPGTLLALTRFRALNHKNALTEDVKCNGRRKLPTPNGLQI